jgi:hypothetical protein
VAEEVGGNRGAGEPGEVPPGSSQAQPSRVEPLLQDLIDAIMTHTLFALGFQYGQYTARQEESERARKEGEGWKCGDDVRGYDPDEWGGCR